MGSHRARHRADQNQSEELATDLLARLADEARPPRSARTRHAAERPGLDPFSTAPFPARTPRTTDADPAGAPAPTGGTAPGSAPTQDGAPAPGNGPAQGGAPGNAPTQGGAPDQGGIPTPRGPIPPNSASNPGSAFTPGNAPTEGGASTQSGAPAQGGATTQGGDPTRDGTYGRLGGAPAQDGAPTQDGDLTRGGAYGPSGAPTQDGDLTRGGAYGPGGAPMQGGAPTQGGAPMQGGIPAPRGPVNPTGARTPGGAGAPEAADHALSLRSGPAAELSSGYHYDPQQAPRFPSDPGAPFPLEDAPAGLLDAPRTGRDRLAALRQKPFYVAVSATVVTAAVAAVAGPSVIVPPAPTPERAPSLAAAALDIAPPGQGSGPVAPQIGGGPAVLAPGQAATSGGSVGPALGSEIAAQAAADAKAYADAQARQAARAAAPRNAPAPKPAPKPAVKPAPKPAVAPATGNSVSARALSLAKGKIGTPYVWGAAGPSAFDCSGLIVWAYKQLGVSLPHSSATLSTMGTPVSKAALQPGDLVFFYSPVSHVGIYAGNGMVLNATQSGEPVQYSKLANLPFHNAMRLSK